MKNTDIEQAFLLLANAVEEVVLVVDRSGVIFANQAAEALFGRPEKELIGLEPHLLLESELALPESGREATLLVRTLTAAGPGPLVSATFCSLGEQRRLWVLRKQESLADLGSMTAGLLHNLAGPLSIVRSNAELLASHLEAARAKHPSLDLLMERWPASVTQSCRSTLDQVDQITTSARELLAKLRGEAARNEQPLDLNQILTREVKFLSNDLDFKHQVKTELSLDPQLPPIQGLYSDFSQSFRNLLRNAVQAMARSPRKMLKVSTAYLAPAQTIQVDIADSGHGIPPEMQSRVFEPFFTTRQAGKQSSGLGLHSVRQLLLPYLVEFAVSSKPGKTVFTLFIPLSRRTSR